MIGGGCSHCAETTGQEAVRGRLSPVTAGSPLSRQGLPHHGRISPVGAGSPPSRQALPRQGRVSPITAGSPPSRQAHGPPRALEPRPLTITVQGRAGRGRSRHRCICTVVLAQLPNKGDNTGDPCAPLHLHCHTPGPGFFHMIERNHIPVFPGEVL